MVMNIFAKHFIFGSKNAFFESQYNFPILFTFQIQSLYIKQTECEDFDH